MSLFGDAFDVSTKAKEKEQQAIKKLQTKSSGKRANPQTLKQQLSLINKEVEKLLKPVYGDKIVVIEDKETLHRYIDKCIANGEMAIDTETNNSLNSLNCKIMGLCIYTPNELAAYVPVNHRDYITKTKLENQVTEEDIKEELSRLGETNIIGHNWKFDQQVLNCSCGIFLSAYWDTMLGAKMLNENEQAGLKWQYADKVDSSVGKYDIETLFRGVEYADVDVDIFALYSATDALITYKLYEYQKKEFEKSDNARVYAMFKDIEMKILDISSGMEIRGVSIDQDYAERLSHKYHMMKEDVDKRIEIELKNLEPQIEKWRRSTDANTMVGKKTKNEQLHNPPEVTSPTQLAILLYDVLKSPVIDKSNPRGTGASIIDKMDFPIVEVLKEQKKVEKLINAFVDVLPQIAKDSHDGRLHGHFNQIGTGTGRFSSTEPNLQQVPSKAGDVRRLFKAKDGYMIIGSDFSQQEPRLLSAYSQEPKLINAYKEGRDLYATLGTSVFNNDYWDNMEHHEDGTPYPEGKKRRKLCKVLYLGITYGMGANKLAESMGVDVEDAQTFLTNFKKGYRVLTEWMDNVQKKAETLGYAEDMWGRRRRLPDAMLPEVELIKEASLSFNPLLYTTGMKDSDNDDNKKSLENEILKARNWKERDSLKKKAESLGYTVKMNGGFKSKAMRQSVNACIQGSAATMTKKAMILIEEDEMMKKYDAHLILAVHDELLMEVKEEYAEEAAERLTYLMGSCIKDTTDIPFKCDPFVVKNWYDDEVAAGLQEELKSGKTKEDILNKHKELDDKDYEYLINFEF